MAVPKTIVTVSSKGVKYSSDIDLVKYSIRELTIAALRDVGKVMRYKILIEQRKLKGFNKLRKGDRIIKGTRYKMNYKNLSVMLGFTHDAWYSAGQELGSYKMPALGIMTGIVRGNIALIREIEGKYLTYINDKEMLLRKLADIENENKTADEGELASEI